LGFFGFLGSSPPSLLPCSKKDKEDNDNNKPNKDDDGYKVQLGKNWVVCTDCKWKRQLTNNEKEAPAQNKVKKCGSCDSIQILFYEKEPFKGSNDKNDNPERERERENKNGDKYVLWIGLGMLGVIVIGLIAYLLVRKPKKGR